MLLEFSKKHDFQVLPDPDLISRNEGTVLGSPSPSVFYKSFHVADRLLTHRNDVTCAAITAEIMSLRRDKKNRKERHPYYFVYIIPSHIKRFT